MTPRHALVILRTLRLPLGERRTSWDGMMKRTLAVTLVLVAVSGPAMALDMAQCIPFLEANVALRNALKEAGEQRGKGMAHARGTLAEAEEDFGVAIREAEEALRRAIGKRRAAFKKAMAKAATIRDWEVRRSAEARAHEARNKAADADSAAFENARAKAWVALRRARTETKSPLDRAANESNAAYAKAEADAWAVYWKSVDEAWTGPRSKNQEVMQRLMRQVASDCERQYGG